MRNVDRIKSLEHELGRYRKKVADQQKELEYYIDVELKKTRDRMI